jgi:tetratricopeptide (TPR) repeat protein
MTVEPIAWLSERKTPLAAFYGLACVAAYAGWAQSKKRRLYFASLVAFMFSLLSKPTTTLLPIALLLLRWWPLGDLLRRTAAVNHARGRALRSVDRRVVWELVPFFAIAGVSAVVTYVSQRDSASVSTPWSPLAVPLLLGSNLGFYLRVLLGAVDLAPFHPFPKPLALTNPEVLFGLGATAGWVALAVLSARRTRALATSLVIFVILLLPALQVLQFTDSTGSDKYLYFPVLGLVIGLGGLLAQATGRAGPPAMESVPTPAGKSGRWRAGRQARSFVMHPATLGVILVGLASAESVATRRQIPHWRTTEGLMRYLVSLYPKTPKLHYDLANGLWDAGKVEEACRSYREAVRLDPTYTSALINLATALAAINREQEAIPLWREVIAREPWNYSARHNLGFYEYERTGHLREALAEYQAALEGYRQQHPGRVDDGQIVSSIGHALLLLGQTDLAIERLAQAANHPEPFPPALAWLGEALAKRGDLPLEIVDRFRRELEDGTASEAFRILGDSLEHAGRHDDALRAGRVAQRLRGVRLSLPPELQGEAGSGRSRTR